MNESHIVVLRQIADVHVLQVTTAELSDRQIVAQVEHELEAYLAENRPAQLVLDFSAVRFITSEGLSALVRVRETAYEGHCHTRLFGLSDNVHEIFRVTRLDKVFPIHDELEGPGGALAACPS